MDREDHGTHRNLTNRLKVAERAIRIVQDLLAQLGPITVEDGVMRAGRRVLNDDTRIVDEVAERTRFGCTIFLGNVRIATTAVAKGEKGRAIGTSANAEITERVFERGETFRGQTTTIGRDWAIVYVPLNDATGERVGMLATYRELLRFDD
ncbi:MAG: cache domain-containing protein [Myxococcota bacterium]